MRDFLGVSKIPLLMSSSFMSSIPGVCQFSSMKTGSRVLQEERLYL